MEPLLKKGLNAKSVIWSSCAAFSGLLFMLRWNYCTFNTPPKGLGRKRCARSPNRSIYASDTQKLSGATDNYLARQVITWLTDRSMDLSVSMLCRKAQKSCESFRKLHQRRLLYLARPLAPLELKWEPSQWRPSRYRYKKLIMKMRQSQRLNNCCKPIRNWTRHAESDHDTVGQKACLHWGQK